MNESTSGPSLGLALLAASLSLAACSDRAAIEPDAVPAEVRAYARARCDRMQRCGCENSSYTSAAECEARVVEIYEDFVAPKDEVILSCFAGAADVWERVTCDELPNVEACEVLPRSDEVGRPCAYNAFGDVYLHTTSCAAGLTCAEDVCVESVVVEVPGEPCSARGTCSLELTCLQGTCEPLRSLGEACERSANCGPARELYCDGERCSPRLANGERCTTDDQCRIGVPCDDGVCAPFDPAVCSLAEL